ncbi:MAG TPA: hypothetical protein PLO56_02615 [Rhodothermales bacterium]|nr:hypothetical protein [Rhodothermales bacterium]
MKTQRKFLSNKVIHRLFWLLFVLLGCLPLSIFAQHNAANPRILVLIPEQIIRRIVPDPAAETEIQRALIQAGFRVVDLQQTERLHAREKAAILLKQDDSITLSDLALRIEADVLITGEAFAEELAVGPLRQSGMTSYRARLELKAIDLSNGQIFYADAMTVSQAGIGDLTTGKAALQKAAEEIQEQVTERLRAWSQGEVRNARQFVLKISNVTSYQKLNALSAKLNLSPKITNVEILQFDSTIATVEIAFNGAIHELAALLESNGLRITNQNAGELRATF